MLEELRVAMVATANKRPYARRNTPSHALPTVRPAPDRLVRLWIGSTRSGIDALITKPRPGRQRKVELQQRDHDRLRRRPQYGGMIGIMHVLGSDGGCRIPQIQRTATRACQAHVVKTSDISRPDWPRNGLAPAVA